ncbi:MAG: kelch motif-containing protein [Thermoplasmata archaeon]|nr:kelch motif-containing protein [Thermoplasmata archaeon]
MRDRHALLRRGGPRLIGIAAIFVILFCLAAWDLPSVQAARTPSSFAAPTASLAPPPTVHRPLATESVLRQPTTVPCAQANPCVDSRVRPSDTLNVWTDISVLSPVAPPPLVYASMAYDTATQSLLLFGGFPYPGSGPTAATWEFANYTWTELNPIGNVSPSARYHASMTYDSNLQGVVLFGGQTSGTSVLGDTWLWKGGQWTQLNLAGGPEPPARSGAAFGFDYWDGYGVLFGGANGSLNYNDTWTFNSGGWTHIHPKHAPSARWDPVVSWDEADHYLLVYGGTRQANQGFGDTWAFQTGNWTNTNAGTPPEDRYVSAATFDYGFHQVLLFGGFQPESCAALGDTWTYSAGLWREQWNDSSGGYGPSPRDGMVMAYDAKINFTVLFGGATGTCSPNQDQNDTWLYGPWTQPPPGVLSATLTATPSSGPAPLTSTLSVHVTGGIQPYNVDIAFGDGTPDDLVSTTGWANTSDIYSPSANYMPVATATDAATHTVTVSTIVSVGTVMVQDWYPPRDTYQFVNYGSYWAGGNCYGISTSEILYWEHDIEGAGDTPYLPVADPATSSLLATNVPPTALNSTTLAIMQHQTEDPHNLELPWDFWSSSLHGNWNNLLSYLQIGQPVTMGLGFNDLHAVVAFGEQTLANGTFLLDISDPNVPLTTTHAWYDPNANQFNYGAAGLHWNGFDVTGTGMPEILQPSWYYPFGDPWNIWNDSYFTSGSGGWTFIAAIQPVTISNGIGSDSFLTPGNSQSFSDGIVASLGIEEGSVQVYAIPDGSVGPGLIIKDPSVGASVIQVLMTNNSTGTQVVNGFSLALDSAGLHSFSVRPTASGFGLDVGNVSNDSTWTNLTFYHLAGNRHAELNASLLHLPNDTVANFAVTNWPGLSSNQSPSVTVVVTPAGGSSATYHLVNGQVGLSPIPPPPPGHGNGGGGSNGSSSTPFYRTTNFLMGVGTGVIVMGVLAALVVLTVRRRPRGPDAPGPSSNPPPSSPPPPGA